MAPPFWVLRCCSCRLFQVQQAKRSGKWSCSVCGQRQAVLKIYGQGSGLDCRHHVQKLNLLQGEAEEAIGWTSGCVADSVTDSKYRAAQRDHSSDQLEGRAEVSRWSQYLDKDGEDQEDGQDEADAERQQLCLQGKNTVVHKRKHQKSPLSSDVQEYAEENGVFQLAYQTKKQKKCLVPDPDDGDAVSGDTMVPAVCESVVPEDNGQTPAACTKLSKWEKFLSCSDNYSENAARAPQSPQEGSGSLGLHSTTAASTGVARRRSEQAGRTLPPGRGFQFKKYGASTEQLALKPPGIMLPSCSCSAEEDVLFKEPPSQVIRAGSGAAETSAGRCHRDSMRTNTLVNCKPRPQPSTSSCESLFCTGDEFDDDL